MDADMTMLNTAVPDIPEQESRLTPQQAQQHIMHTWLSPGPQGHLQQAFHDSAPGNFHTMLLDLSAIIVWCQCVA